jgi:uncharacterized protein (DUF924 family)
LPASGLAARPDYADLLDFWFSEAMRPRWFASTPELDREIRDRYEELWQRAHSGGLDDWQVTAEGALALVIVLDQLPLNMYRDRPEGYASERGAVRVAARAIAAGLDRQLPAERLAFLYLPFMHSEDPADQDRSVALFQAAGLPTRWPEHHRDIIRRFGRFPHRNAVLGRDSTPEELAYLAAPGAFMG